MDNTAIKNAMTIRLDNALPEYPKFVEGIRRASGSEAASLP